MQATAPIDLQTSRVSNGEVTGQSGESSFMLAYVMSFLLYIALILYGNQVMSSILEEKSNRIMEVLVSSLSPFQLMLGKVLGVSAVALLQLGIWSGTAKLLTSQRTAIAGLLGVSATQAMAMPIPAINGDLLVVYLLFFVLGFFLYAAAYAAVAATCNTQQEAQQAAIPVTMCIAVGLILLFGLARRTQRQPGADAEPDPDVRAVRHAGAVLAEPASSRRAGAFRRADRARRAGCGVGGEPHLSRGNPDVRQARVRCVKCCAGFAPVDLR